VGTATLEFDGREAVPAAAETSAVLASVAAGIPSALPAVPAKPAVTVPAPQRTRRRQNAGDRVFLGILTGAGWVAPALLALFLAVLLYGAWPSIRAFGFSFLTSSTWEPNPVREKYGAFPFLVGTLVSSLLALCLAAPVGIAVATFINEILPSRLRGPSRFLIEILATVPSVVYGLWGVFVLAPTVMNVLKPGLTKTFFYLPFFGPPYDPRNMLCAVLILSIMVLPVIVAVSLGEDSDRAWDLLAERHPNLTDLAPPGNDDVATMIAECRYVSVLDYSQGLGHAESLTIEAT
jgi:phosphate transport system permease protein